MTTTTTEREIVRVLKSDDPASYAFDAINETESVIGYVFARQSTDAFGLKHTEYFGRVIRIDAVSLDEVYDGAYIALIRRDDHEIGYTLAKALVQELVVYPTAVDAFKARTWRARNTPNAQIACWHDGCDGALRYVDSAISAFGCEAHPPNVWDGPDDDFDVFDLRANARVTIRPNDPPSSERMEDRLRSGPAESDDGIRVPVGVLARAVRKARIEYERVQPDAAEDECWAEFEALADYLPEDPDAA